MSAQPVPEGRRFQSTPVRAADAAWLEIITEDWARDRLVAIYDSREHRLVGFVDHLYAEELLRLLEARGSSTL